MMYILNDYSIDNQFTDIEVFLDSLVDHTIPLLKVMDDYNLDLLKSHQIFDLKITRGLSIFELLNLRGYPEIAGFKSLLHKRLYDDPYWEKEGLDHDCISEAFKRKIGLISFEHKEYLQDRIEHKVDNTIFEISNSYNNMQLIEGLWERDFISINEYLEQKYSIIESFCIIKKENYFTNFVKFNDIKQNEINKIASDLNDFMSKYLNKQDLGRLSKPLERNLYEFRTSIGDSKEVRILYCLNESKISFLNCFIKKQQKTPENEKQLGRRLMEYILKGTL